MTLPPDGALMDWARRSGPSKVLEAVRTRLERGHSLERGSLPIELTEAERHEIGQLLGIGWLSEGGPVRVRALVRAVADRGTDIETLLSHVSGPVRSLVTERHARMAAAEAERQRARRQLVSAGVGEDVVDRWLRGRGLPAAGGGRLELLAAQAASVWQHLGSRDTLHLASLAADAVGDPKALDRPRRLGRAVLRLAFDGATDPPVDAEAWRAAWEDLGVMCDPVSSRVLVLNLVLVGDAPACVLTAAAAGVAEPLWLTWRSMNGRIRPAASPKPVVVFVCENPTIVAAAADRLGPRCLPLVCTSGRPTGAARRLLGTLVDAGVHLRIRADDDMAGQQIVAALQRLAPGSELWRYDARKPGDSATDPRYEEQDLELMLEDLDAAGEVPLYSESIVTDVGDRGSEGGRAVAVEEPSSSASTSPS